MGKEVFGLIKPGKIIVRVYFDYLLYTCWIYLMFIYSCSWIECIWMSIKDNKCMWHWLYVKKVSEEKRERINKGKYRVYGHTWCTQTPKALHKSLIISRTDIKKAFKLCNLFVWKIGETFCIPYCISRWYSLLSKMDTFSLFVDYLALIKGKTLKFHSE